METETEQQGKETRWGKKKQQDVFISSALAGLHGALIIRSTAQCENK